MAHIAPRSLPGSVAVAAAKKQDLRSPDASDAAVRGFTRATPVSQPAAPKPVATDTGTGSDIDWATIGIAVLLSLIAIGGIALFSTRRQHHMPRSA